MVYTMYFTNATVVFPSQMLEHGWVEVQTGRIVAVGAGKPPRSEESIDLEGNFLVPGFIDLHVHGGAGHDFMDGTEEAFRAVCQAHLRHGTTSLTPTTTVARHEQHL